MRPSQTLARLLPTFVLVANELSFSAAARRLSVTPAAVSKTIRALEEELGTTLFHRSTRALTMTDDAEGLLRSVEPLLAEMDDALTHASKRESRPRGLLRVTLPETFGRLYVVPLLAEFCERYPEVELDLLFDDTSRDLVRDRIDVAIGLRTAPKPGLIGRRLCKSRLFTLASPGFLERHGTPSHPRDLARLPCLGFRQSSGQRLAWRYEDGDEEVVIRPPLAVTASSLEALCELAAHDYGITLSGWMALPYLRDRRLEVILEPYERELPPIMIYHRTPENMSPRARAFIDHVTATFEAPHWP